MLTTPPVPSARQYQGLEVISLGQLNRRKSLDEQGLRNLILRLEEIQHRDDVRLVLLEGMSGVFSTGPDHEELLELRRTGQEERFRSMLDAVNRAVMLLAVELRVPVLAAAEGPAVGWGFGLVLASDFTIASTRATFGATQILAGLHPDFGLTYFLPERLGPALALELCLSGRILDAHDAQKIGLVSRVAPPHAFSREVGSLAARICGAPKAVAVGLKQRVGDARRRALEETLREETRAQLEAFRSKDALDRMNELHARFDANVTRPWRG